MDYQQARLALVDAVKTAGSQSAFARGVGTSQQRISYLITHGRVLPAELVRAAEELTGVSRHVLRPDIYPLQQSNSSYDGFPPAVVPLGAATVACDRSAVLYHEAHHG